MVRPLLALPIFVVMLTPAWAQATAPAPANTTVAPAAGMQPKPDPRNFLTGIYATKAVIELCQVTIDQNIATAMLADQVRYERELQFDPGTAVAAYDTVKTSVANTKPDCTEGSVDRQGVEVVLGAYSRQ